MIEIYTGRHGPQPLGTVVFEEIEAKAREKLKDYGGAFAVIYFQSCIRDVIARRFHVRWWKCWYKLHLSR